LVRDAVVHDHLSSLPGGKASVPCSIPTRLRDISDILAKGAMQAFPAIRVIAARTAVRDDQDAYRHPSGPRRGADHVARRGEAPRGQPAHHRTVGSGRSFEASVDDARQPAPVSVERRSRATEA